MAALLSIWGCTSSLQTAQNTGESDDLYGSSSNAQVYASASNAGSSVAQRPTRQRALTRGRDANPDYNDEQQYGAGSDTDEYYSELSTRKLNRGISPDPGWIDNSTNSYNNGFANGYNAAQTSAMSWNRWGFNNMGFYSGLGLGLGLGYGGLGGFGYSPFYGGFNSPYMYDSFAYSPYGLVGLVVLDTARFTRRLATVLSLTVHLVTAPSATVDLGRAFMVAVAITATRVM